MTTARKHAATSAAPAAALSILIDGRENAPWRFERFGVIEATAVSEATAAAVLTWRWAHLKTGDYSLAGLEDLVAVERKSLKDLYSTLGQHRERFEAEHERLTAMQFAAVVIEADWHTILTSPPPESRLNPKSVFGTFVSWQQKYGVPWLAMGSRELAEITCFRILQKFAEHHRKQGARDRVAAILGRMTAV